ncbi:MAG: hypothetical protein K2Y01_01115 [Rhabdochlamydiaceae bacterium]|nr:hypothetical protein [Rhabdochlamydiaceae bacterium]
MALAYLFLMLTIGLSFIRNRLWMYLLLWVDFVLVLWLFIHHMTIQLNLNL